MMRVLIVLIIGLVIGYAYGFSDARKHDRNVAVRLIERAGGSTRDRVGTDVDRKLEELEKPE